MLLVQSCGDSLAEGPKSDWPLDQIFLKLNERRLKEPVSFIYRSLLEEPVTGLHAKVLHDDTWELRDSVYSSEPNVHWSCQDPHKVGKTDNGKYMCQ